METSLSSQLPPMIPKPEIVVESDLHQYFLDCKNFDWKYQFSDDDSKYQKGRKRHIQLSMMSGYSDMHERIFNDWYMYMFNGPAFGTPGCPMPVWETYRETH